MGTGPICSAAAYCLADEACPHLPANQECPQASDCRHSCERRHAKGRARQLQLQSVAAFGREESSQMSTEKRLSEALEPVAVDNSSRLIMDLARRVAGTDCSVPATRRARSMISRDELSTATGSSASLNLFSVLI